MSRGSYNRHPEYYSKPVNVKVTTINDFDADGKPRQTVTVETVDPDKEKKERNEKNAAILFFVLLYLFGIGLTIYSILKGCNFI